MQRPFQKKSNGELSRNSINSWSSQSEDNGDARSVKLKLLKVLVLSLESFALVKRDPFAFAGPFMALSQITMATLRWFPCLMIIPLSSPRL